MTTDLSITPPPRRWAARMARVLLAVSVVALVTATEPAAGPAGAATPIILGESVARADYQQGFGNLEIANRTMPDCQSKNLTGDYGAAHWKVTSSLGENSVVFPGHEWTITATMYGDHVDYDPWNYNDGPDPLHLQLIPLGPIEQVDRDAESGATPNSKAYMGNLWTGVKGPLGTWGYTFDANSGPKLDGVHKQPSDGVDVKMTFTVRATEPGVISLPNLDISGYDDSPKAGPIGCLLPVGFQWTVIAPDVPVAKPEAVTTDARYSAAVAGDANGGNHTVVVPVLANDDDPNVPGGPGDTDQVRLAAWDTTSDNGGTVSCGDQADNGAPPSTPFDQLAVGPCTYTPAVGFSGNDLFHYAVRSATGLQSSTAVAVVVKANPAPTATPVVFGTATNVDDTFDLSSSVGDVYGEPLTCSLTSQPAAGGTAVITPGCELIWDNTDPGFTGNVQIGYRVCDTHATRDVPDLGAGVTRAAGYSDGTPDDLSSSTARRCATSTATIAILPGLVLPITAGTDHDVVDAGYPLDGIGDYTVRIPVLDNDTDGNGPAPAVPGVDLELADAPDPAEGTASIDGDEVLFTPAAGFEGPVSFTYRVCEDPLAQNPPYVDDPQTPLVNEGLPVCGLGTVQLDVVGNEAPGVNDDEATIAHDEQLVDLDLGANDASDDGLVCTVGVPVVSAPGLVSSVSIDAACRLDLDPVEGTEGVVEVTYEACDAHVLADPAHPEAPYGTDGRSPGELAPRCAEGVATVTVLGPIPPVVDDPMAGDPPPVCAADEAQTIAGQAVTIEVLANDSDLAQGGVAGTVTLTGPPADEPGATEAGGTAAMDDAQRVVFSPAGGFVGTDTFTYTARDDLGQGCVGTVEVTVTADPAGNGGVGSGGVGSGNGGAGTGGDGTGGTTTTTTPTAGAPGTAAAATTAATTGSLPRTGSPAALALAGLGTGLAAVGAVAVGVSRRLRRA